MVIRDLASGGALGWSFSICGDFTHIRCSIHSIRRYIVGAFVVLKEFFSSILYPAPFCADCLIEDLLDQTPKLIHALALSLILLGHSLPIPAST